ncbi:MAG: NAD(P)H-hydrate dehydratase [Candidatus Eremiobacterota bacterium]
MRVVTGTEMAELDRQAIEDFHIPGVVLMESAGRACFRAARAAWPRAATWAVLCGPGNNGGDGFVLARTLANNSGRPRVALLGAPERLQGDALYHYRALLKVGCPVEALTLETLAGFLAESELIVDALFGTGLTRPLEGLAAEVVDRVNRALRPVLAVDIPSGVCSRTGGILGTAVRADRTVTMGLPKAGLLLHPGAERVGRLEVAEIGFPSVLLEAAGHGVLVDPDLVRGWLPRRPPTAHKGTCGHALLLAGSERYPGAASLCTLGALRAGAGLVTLAAPEPVRWAVQSRVPEALTVAHNLGVDDLTPHLAGKQSVCIGPGIGSTEATRATVRSLAPCLSGPLLVDADALRALAGGAPLDPSRVLTPHPGEMSALLEREVAELESDRVAAARECAERYRCVTVYKGAPTVVATPDGSFWINPSGTPVLSQGGTGDVLSGTITGLMAQGLEPARAAVCGVYLHGLAARLCARADGPRGVLAREVARAIPRAMALVLSGKGPTGLSLGS